MLKAFYKNVILGLIEKWNIPQEARQEMGSVETPKCSKSACSKRTYSSEAPHVFEESAGKPQLQELSFTLNATGNCVSTEALAENYRQLPFRVKHDLDRTD